MNQFFSFDRFSLLVWKHWAEHKKRYILSLFAFTGLLAAWFLFTIPMQDEDLMSEDMQRASYFFSLFLAGTFYASHYFRDFGSKEKAANFLMVPASVFEKFLCGLLYTFVLFFIVFTTAFYLVDLLMVSIANRFYATDRDIVNVFHTPILRFGDGSTLGLLFVFFLIQSVFLLGAVLFPKYSFVKTIVAGFVAGLSIAGLVYFVYRQNVPEVDQPVELAGWITQSFRILVMCVITPVIWVITYYRLKAK